MIAIMRMVGGFEASCGTFNRRRRSVFNRSLAVALVLLAVAGAALAQTMPQPMPDADHHGAGTLPVLPGQDAFGAVQEIVRLLEAAPETDWLKVDLAALREHLIDMNRVTLEAVADQRIVANGLAVAATGSGRTLAAIRRMVTAQAAELNGSHGWTAAAEPLPEGVLLTVTSTDPKEVAHIRGLGFIGLLASGSHHQRHHLAIARGEPLH
jgi:hypothetical protein